MYNKKETVFKSPDVTKLQAVIIDRNTIIYIAPGDDPEEARSRYLVRASYKRF